ncbi:hypothetical protein CL660_003200 [bacterium]|nr:hypothetical protein [bacterium]|tara:strand:- start:393 stop:692 length:300 start_codon:yes stop_codon:yes gene_type:complete
MGMSKDELNEIKSKYLEEEIHMILNKNLKVLEKNLKNTQSVHFNYNIFKFTYTYSNENNALYEKISINNSKKIYNHVHQAPYDMDRIISNRIKWILERV